MVSILRGFKNGQNTDLDKGTIRNADAVLLLLNEAGGTARVGELRAALRAWRPNRHFNYLFQMYSGSGGYGFAGSNFASATTRVYHYGTGFGDKGHESDRRTYYYRSGRGTYAITAEGFRRLAELGVR